MVFHSLADIELIANIELTVVSYQGCSPKMGERMHEWRKAKSFLNFDCFEDVARAKIQ